MESGHGARAVVRFGGPLLGLTLAILVVLVLAQTAAGQGSGRQLWIDGAGDFNGGQGKAADWTRVGAYDEGNKLIATYKVNTPDTPTASEHPTTLEYRVLLGVGVSGAGGPGAGTCYDTRMDWLANGAFTGRAISNVGCKGVNEGAATGTIPFTGRVMCNEVQMILPYSSFGITSGSTVQFGVTTGAGGVTGGLYFTAFGTYASGTNTILDAQNGQPKVQYQTGTPYDLYRSAPENLQASMVGDNVVRLTWDAGPDVDAQETRTYAIYRSGDGGASWVNVDDVPATTNEWEDSFAAQDSDYGPVTYQYLVSAINCEDFPAKPSVAGQPPFRGGESDRSNTATVTPDFRPNATTLGVVDATVDNVELSWTSVEDKPAAGTAVAGHRIYRSTTPGLSTADLIDTVGVVTQYDDGTVGPGMTYYYAVAAFDGLTPWSNNATFSNEVVANTPPLVTSIAPATGPVTGGTPVTITGAGFSTGLDVMLDGIAATDVTVVDANTVTATTPAHGAGLVDVTVTLSSGAAATLEDAFTYEASAASPPTLTVGAINVYAGQSVEVDASMLSATHETAPDSDLVYTLDLPTGTGTFYKDAVAMDATTTFTQADLSAGLIEFTAGPSPATDDLGVQVAVGADTDAGALPITVTEAPELSIDNSGPMSVALGATKTITTSLLAASYDLESADGLVYTLDATPDVGIGALAWGATLDPVPASFTQADIDAGKLRFVATMAGGTTSFDFTVTADVDGASESGTFEITAGSPTPPTADFETDPITIVAGLPAEFKQLATEGTGSITSYTWDLGDGSAPKSGAIVTHTYATPGFYDVNLTVDDDTPLSDWIEIEVEVVAPTGPTAAIKADGPFYVGSPISISFDGSAGDAPISSYTWTLDDGSPPKTGASISHTYAAVGPYTITLLVEDELGLQDTATLDIDVVAPPIQPPTFIANILEGRVGTIFRFTDTTSPSTDISLWEWDFDDGSQAATSTAGQAVTHTYDTPGIYSVRLTITKGGHTASMTKHISIMESPLAIPPSGLPYPAVSTEGPTTQFPPTAVITGPDEAPEGSLVWLDGTASLSPLGRGLEYSWTHLSGPAVQVVGDGSPWLRFAAPSADKGTVVFVLVVSDGVLSSEPVKHEFTSTPVEQGNDEPAPTPLATFFAKRQGSKIVFEPEGDTEDMVFHWDFGDGTTSSNAWADHAYDEPGSYTVQLTVTNKDGVRAFHTVDVNAPGQDDGPGAFNAASTPDGRPAWQIAAILGGSFILLGAIVALVVAIWLRRKPA